ncbi:hypothetical protein B0T17DRAFT_515185 [Bombardia bombarda]|uniref:Uncharacterized protein n=1 Tax=Bombardia bombarda TaxID=252184 RepID=A0AA40CE32_9PEZI|nr:hypothetical protein B0T17DRAFT_515185 [Bombardia bombarda]
MRFFQHFLLQCHGPRHAVGSKNNSTWPHQVPFLSQKHEHLMHAILGYAASDLMQHDASLVAPALVHRHKAVNDIKRALLSVSDMPPKPSSSSSSSSSSSRTTLEQEEEEENNNALMATCLVLTFQSVLLDDGMVGYMTFARGIAIVASHMHARGIKSIFRGGEMEKTKEEGDERPEQQPQYQEPLLVPLIDKSCAGAVAVMAVQTLEPLLRDNNNPIEREYHRMLLDMARQLRVSSWRGALAKHYAWWMTLPHEQFQHVANQNNQAMLLLATHWIALKQIIMMATSTTTVGSQAEEMGIDMGMKRWLSHLNSHVHLEYAEFNSWPRWVEMQMQLGLDRNASFLRK